MADGLLFLHAWPLDGTMWEPQVRAIRERAPGVPVCAPSLPGFGGTLPAVEGVVTMEAAGQAAVEAAAASGMDRFVLCGASMGGYVAFAIRRAHPERVLGMVLANTRATADDEAGRRGREQLARRLREEGSDFLVQNPPPLLAASAPPELREHVRDMIRAQPAEAIAAATLGMARRADSTPDLRGIDVPTLVVEGTEDAIIPAGAAAAMAAAIPGATLETIEGAGHLTSMEAPDRFTELLGAHLRRCGLPL